MTQRSIWIGYEPRETDAYLVAAHSLRWHMVGKIPIQPIILRSLELDGLYVRSHRRIKGQLFDNISQAPMSTEFAISRFFTPHLAMNGWALFMDCDMLVRADIGELFALADPQKAVMCVHHDHRPKEDVKMDDQAQLRYARKNWSSVMLFNCDHPSNRALTLEQLNILPGRDLHRFCWLRDEEIGELPYTWNYLAGYSEPRLFDPKIVHFTLGIPRMEGYAKTEFAEEWELALHDALRSEAVGVER